MERLTVFVALTARDATAKVATVAPAGTVIRPGPEAAAGFSLENVRMTPPLGAACFNTTIPIEESPPLITGGTSANFAAGWLLPHDLSFWLCAFGMLLCWSSMAGLLARNADMREQATRVVAT